MEAAETDWRCNWNVATMLKTCKEPRCCYSGSQCCWQERGGRRTLYSLDRLAILVMGSGSAVLAPWLGEEGELICLKWASLSKAWTENLVSKEEHRPWNYVVCKNAVLFLQLLALGARVLSFAFLVTGMQ